MLPNVGRLECAAFSVALRNKPQDRFWNGATGFSVRGERSGRGGRPFGPESASVRVIAGALVVILWAVMVAGSFLLPTVVCRCARLDPAKNEHHGIIKSTIYVYELLLQGRRCLSPSCGSSRNVTPNAERRTRNAELGTPNSERRTRNAELGTPNSERETRNSERRTHPSRCRLAARARKRTFSPAEKRPRLVLTTPFVICVRRL